MTNKEHWETWLLQASPDGLPLKTMLNVALSVTAQAIDRARTYTTAHLWEQYHALCDAYEKAQTHLNSAATIEQLGHFLHVLEVRLMVQGASPAKHPHHT